MALVSVITAVKNGMPYISETINSVLNQTFSDFEYIILDDGSTDNTKDAVLAFKDSRIKFIEQPNSGVAKARNMAIQHSSGKYLAIVDADDVWHPEKLALQVQFLEDHGEYVLVGSFVNIIDKEGDYLYTEKKPITDEENRILLNERNAWTHSSTLFRRSTFDDVGGYYEPVQQFFEDYILMYQLAKRGKVYQIPQVLADYRIVPGSLSNKTETPTFVEIKKKAIKDGFLEDKDIQYLLSEKAKNFSSPEMKQGQYYLYLGRSFLFHNFNRIKAKGYLKQSLEYNSGNKTAKIYFWMAMLCPQFCIQFIYNRMSAHAGYTEVRL